MSFCIKIYSSKNFKINISLLMCMVFETLLLFVRAFHDQRLISMLKDEWMDDDCISSENSVDF